MSGSPAESLDGDNAESHFVQANDGTRLHYLRWSDGSGTSWAVVLFLHGIASHGGWFGETATDLSENGVAVYAPDRRGSGRSDGERGHLSRYELGLNDVDEMLAVASSEHVGTPLFLTGSSWAAKLALVHASMGRAPLAGLMLLGPGLFPKVALSPGRTLEVIVGHFVAPKARIDIPLTPELYTSTPHYIDLVRADRLRLLTATTQFFWQTARLDRRRRNASRDLRLPLLVLQGGGDAMMDVPTTAHWYSALGNEDKTYVEYPKAGHTLDFELDRAQYLGDMLAWLSARARGGPPAMSGP
jgi:acylglycerol lipase